ncbi:MAG TPA: NAD(P)/FAD-dependent oxidoreductase [Steroidobacteraceae bacterium]|nr:NAD(P)/FAD-dependent oxidoreductase [Steroidobacteraceae bacterium]
MSSVSAGSCDVLVIGGGPAGSVTAGMLAKRGFHVVLLEKERHPRFHIGESLLPANLPLLEQFGVASQVRAIGIEKWGAEFISPWDGRQQEFEFAGSWNKSMPFAYQVRRSEFDEILFRRAGFLGAEVVEACRATDVEFSEAGRDVRVLASLEDGKRCAWAARYVVDASGRDTLLGNRLHSKRRNKKHNSAAIYAHFTDARRNSGKRAGNISIFWFDHGWFWFIPLADGATSVGAVVWPGYLKTRSSSIEEFFLATIAKCAPLAERLAGAHLATEVTATGNYSYACDRTCGSNYFLVGDAYAFIDPVFSSGVMFAMQNAMAAADAIEICLREPERTAAAHRDFDRLMRHGPRQFSWFIYRITNPTMRELFLDPKNFLRMQEALLSVLAGDIFGRTPIWTSLRLFKLLYYLLSLAHWQRTLQASRRRRSDIRPAEPEQRPPN